MCDTLGYWGAMLGGTFTFGDFELDGRRFELRRAGRPITVQPKVLKLLLLLVSQRHRSVSDGEIMAQVWPAETVSRASIKRAVMGARTALDNRSQDCIRTVRGHGYQFVMPLSEAPGPVSESDPAAPGLAKVAPGDSDFVGRGAVLAELDAALADALGGRGRCVLVVGEPGIGKTRVLREFSTRAAAVGARVWLGRCSELDGAPAFWPVLQILREAAQGFSPDELRQLLGPGASDLAEAFPELSLWLADLPTSPTIGSVPARFRFFDSMAQFLARAAARAPLVLMLDDLQRADHPTLRLLIFLAAQLETSPILIVATARTSGHRDGGVAELIAELGREGAASKFALQGLNSEELGRYLGRHTGAAAPAEVVARLHEQTAGNPLFLEAVLRSLRTQDHRAGDPGEDNWDRLARVEQSHGVRGAIERHLEVLSLPCRSLLGSAALLGSEFSVGLLLQLVDRPAEEVMAQLSEAVEAGAIKTSLQRLGHYHFHHALIRDVLYDRLDAAERTRQHARAGLALEANGAASDDSRLAQLAEHFRCAAPTHDGGKALHYARRAADHAMAGLAWEEAADHFGRALELLELSGHDGAQQMQLLLARGEALVRAAEPTRARADLLRAVALARERGAIDVIVQAARLIARPRESGSVDQVRIDLVREALAALPATDGRTASLRALLAKSLTYTPHHSERSELALSALKLSQEQATDPELQTEVLQACHEALTFPEHFDERVRIAAELTRLAHAHGDPRTRLCALAARFQNTLESGEVAGMDAAITGLEALMDQVRDPTVSWYARTYRSTRLRLDGEYEEAAHCADDSLALGNIVGEELARHNYCVQTFGALRMQGKLAEAEAMVREMCTRYPALSAWRASAACVEADHGRLAVARDMLRQIIDPDLHTLRRDPYLLSALCAAAELCARVGEPTDARLVYDALLPYEGRNGNVSYGAATYGPVSNFLAQAALRMGEPATAERHCERGIAAGEAMPSLTFTMMGRLVHAMVLSTLKRPAAHGQAMALLNQVRPFAEETGLLGVAFRCHVLAQEMRPALATVSARA